MITIKEVERFYNDNLNLLGYRERKVFNGFNTRIEKDKNNYGVYTFLSDKGSFEFAWDLVGYQRGTVLS